MCFIYLLFGFFFYLGFPQFCFYFFFFMCFCAVVLLCCCSSYREKKKCISKSKNVFRMCLMKMIICIFHEHVIWYYFNILFLVVSFAVSASVSSRQWKKKKKQRTRKHICFWITFIFHHQIVAVCARSHTQALSQSLNVLINSVHISAHAS